jgi:serine/threonine protein kinase
MNPEPEPEPSRSYAAYQDHLNVYMILSYHSGGELFSHLRRAGRFSTDVSRYYIATVALALAYLHRQGIVFRDIKPENILIGEDGYVRLCDFGFAKHVGHEATFTLCGE